MVNVLPSVTKRLKEVEVNSQLKTDPKDARLICRLAGDSLYVGFLSTARAFPAAAPPPRHTFRGFSDGSAARAPRTMTDLAWNETSSCEERSPMSPLRLPCDVSA